jgi:hypothetical protein
MKKSQDNTMFDKSTKRGKKIGFLITIAMPLLALALGLYLRQWLAERSARAADLPSSSPIMSSAPSKPLVAENPQETPRAVFETASSESGQLTQRVNGIEVSARNFRVTGGRVWVNVCFDLPDNSDWTIWNASLNTGGKEFSYSGFMPIEVRDIPINGQQRVITFDENGGMNQTWEPAASGQKGLRCDALYFDVSADLAPAEVTLVIHSLAAYPREGEECTPAYLERVQKALDARASGIRIKCKIESYESGGSSGVEIVDKPTAMSMEQAAAMLSDPEMFLDLHGIRGPWVFIFDPK